MASKQIFGNTIKPPKVNTLATAECTSSLAKRIRENEKGHSIDLNKWIFSQLSHSSSINSILELCSGTGKQTDYLVELNPKACITCIDISEDAINCIRKKKYYESTRINLVQNGLDEFMHQCDDKYDLIFCAYGMYYSKNPDILLERIYHSLNSVGSFIVVGPYGNNNSILFNLLKRCGVKISNQIMYSSSHFMSDKVLLHSITRYRSIKIRTMVNTVKWRNIKSVIDYWRNSTFYNKEKEAVVKRALENHFSSNSEFINEKHVMLIRAFKNDQE